MIDSIQNITFIYTYRNLDVARIEKSLESLKNQTNKNFYVLLIDYGSEEEFSGKIKNLLNKYNFCTYLYVDTKLLPWSRAHALNIGIKNCKSNYIFTSDIDIIYSEDFVKKQHQLKSLNKVISFQVAYLKKSNKKWQNINKFKIDCLSIDNATGMSLFNKEDLLKVKCFDEKFIYWGGEDNDLIIRLKNNGVITEFYDKEVLLYHQWHKKFYDDKNKFPTGINDFLITSPILKIFQKSRKMGEVLEIDYNNYKLIDINAYRYGLIYKLSSILLEAENGEKFCFAINNIKDDEKYYTGKSYFIKRLLSIVLTKINLRIEWSNYKNHKLYYHEILPLIINFILATQDRYELEGINSTKDKLRIYIKKCN
ncbi:MAG: glycosyltransferase [Bacteroidetes bacterium]|nr:glycosyltransferase [Bacteroidota bacterium]